MSNPYREVIFNLLVDRDGDKCQECGVALGFDNGQVDHVIPASLGGADDMSNFQLMCGPCNASKGNGGRTRRPRKPQAAPTLPELEDGPLECYYCELVYPNEESFADHVMPCVDGEIPNTKR